MELAKVNECGKCPENTSTPIFDTMVHLRGFPGGEFSHVMTELKVIEGTAKEVQKIS